MSNDSDNQEQELQPIDPDRIYDLPLTEIYADEDFNCRGIIDPTSVVELAHDIKQKEKELGEGKGLISPIIVQPWLKKAGKKWRIVAGYRRFKAHVLNQAKTIR